MYILAFGRTDTRLLVSRNYVIWIYSATVISLFIGAYSSFRTNSWILWSWSPPPSLNVIYFMDDPFWSNYGLDWIIRFYFKNTFKSTIKRCPHITKPLTLKQTMVRVREVLKTTTGLLKKVFFFFFLSFGIKTYLVPAQIILEWVPTRDTVV